MCRKTMVQEYDKRLIKHEVFSIHFPLQQGVKVQNFPICSSINYLLQLVPKFSLSNHSPSHSVIYGHFGWVIITTCSTSCGFIAQLVGVLQSYCRGKVFNSRNFLKSERLSKLLFWMMAFLVLSSLFHHDSKLYNCSYY